MVDGRMPPIEPPRRTARRMVCRCGDHRRKGSVCACIMRAGEMVEGGGGRRSGVDQHHRHSAADGMADYEQEGAVCVLMGQGGACFDVNRG